MTIAVPTNLTLRTAFEHHLKVFGSASPVVMRTCYPGMSQSAYTKAYSLIHRRPVLRERANAQVLIDPIYLRSKLIPLDETAMAMGDALCAHLWSGCGQVLIGETFDWRLQELNLHPDELPSAAARGFLGRSVVWSPNGTVFLPFYVGCGARSSAPYLKDMEARFIDTWHTLLALPSVSSVVVIAHGYTSTKYGLDALKRLAHLVDSGVEARGVSLAPRSLRQLHWSFGFLKFHELPLTTLNLVFHPTMRTSDGRLRATLGWTPSIGITPKGARRWLWEGGTKNL